MPSNGHLEANIFLKMKLEENFRLHEKVNAKGQIYQDVFAICKLCFILWCAGQNLYKYLACTYQTLRSLL